MSNEYILEVSEREDIGSGSVNKLRRQGLVPANYYFHGSGNHNLVVDQKVLYTAMHSDAHIFVINLGKKKYHVQIKDVQYHPVTDEIMHIDLMGFKMTDKITITVPIVINGEAAGVKEGGVLAQNINQVEVTCLPTAVPDKIEIDVAELELNNHISVADLDLGEDVEITTNLETVIIAVQVPTTEVEPEVVEEVEEGEELEEDEEGEEGEADEDVENEG